MEVARWLSDVVQAGVVGADTWATEVIPTKEPGCVFCIHTHLLTRHGIVNQENMDLDGLSADKAYRFLYVFCTSSVWCRSPEPPVHPARRWRSDSALQSFIRSSFSMHRRLVAPLIGLAAMTAVAARSDASSPSGPVPAESIAWVTVGDLRNAVDTDPAGLGSVATSFRIMTYEFTNQQYADVLSAVAKTDRYALYNASMGTDARGGITRSGVDGSYVYAVKPNMGDKPVNYVSWFDVARVANWYTNGATSTSGTETGAYTLGGATSGAAPAVNAGATYHIPTADQWYKAAY